MKTIKFNSDKPISRLAKNVLRQAKTEVYGDEQITFVSSEPAEDVLCLGTHGGVRTINPAQMTSYPNAVGFLVEALRRLEYGSAIDEVPERYPSGH